jgi:hypothetical protein
MDLLNMHLEEEWARVNRVGEGRRSREEAK